VLERKDMYFANGFTLVTGTHSLRKPAVQQ
jgi:hypothetical protein